VEELVGRVSELESIERWLRAPPPSVLVLDGEPGIGKTTLWRAGIEEAERQGYRVLACAAVLSETQLSFTALRDLLDPVFDEVADELPSPQRHALAVTLLRDEPAGAPPDSGAISVGILTALRALAASRPLLVAIDDVQWLDPASEGPLSYALRRLEDEPVAVLVGQRRTAGASNPLGLDRLAGYTVLDVGPLSVGAFGKLLHERLGTAYARPILRRLHETAGGNPFYGIELARSLEGAATPLRPGDVLRVPGTLNELVQDRLTSLPGQTLDVLAAASAFSRPTIPVLEAALEQDVPALLRPAIDADVVEIDGDDVRFSHPLFAAAVYERAAPRRRELHARLAEVVVDLEERARHLALATTEPSAVVASTLEAAANAAASRGAVSAAAALAEEAYRLTPPNEPRDRTLRALSAGWFQFIVGDAARARALLEESERTAPTGDLRARARTRLGWLEHHAGDRRLAAEHYQAALEDAEDDRQRAEIFSLLAWSYAITRTNASEAARYARLAVELCDAGVDDVALLADTLAVLGQAEFFLGGGLPSAAMERALSLPPSTKDLRVLRRPTNHWGFMLLCADRFDEARPLFQEVHRRALDLGDESAVPWPLMRLCHLELAAGNWAAAERYLEEGLDAAIVTGQVPVRADLTCTAALVYAHVGRVDEARATAAEGLELANASSSGIGPRLAEWALGMVELAEDDARAAAERLAPMWEASKSAGVLDPGENRYLGDLGEALVAIGDLAGADRLADELGALGKQVERPSAIGIALRVEGQAAAASGELDRALAVMREAAEVHEHAGLPFELGRTLLALGSVERRARRRRDARETLQRALAVFDDLGAALWAGNARAELGRIGGRAPSPGGLTPTEQRVVELVTHGKSNKEVATELVVSVHTVEAALTSVYRKLDVRSRTELAHKLAGGG
jgi:DNA-binding CsgD family transcriptional regulator